LWTRGTWGTLWSLGSCIALRSRRTGNDNLDFNTHQDSTRVTSG
jgi:hypothetical protein